MEIRIHQTLAKKPKKYYWEIINEKGKILAASENYRSYSKCLHDLVYVALSAFSAKIIDATGTEPRLLNASSNIDLNDLEGESLNREDALLAPALENPLDSLELGETEPRIRLGNPD